MKGNKMKRLIILLIAFMFMGCSVDPQAGDVWEYCFDKGNPFKKEQERCYLYEILETKEGYVKYKIFKSYVPHMVGVVDSKTILYFKIGSERISTMKGE